MIYLVRTLIVAVVIVIRLQVQIEPKNRENVVNKALDILNYLIKSIFFSAWAIIIFYVMQNKTWASVLLDKFW